MIAELKPWYRLVKVFGSGAALTGIVIGLRRRRWDILGLLLFVIPFFLVHSFRARTQPRYCMPIAWIVLLLCWYGLREFWGWFNASPSLTPTGSVSVPGGRDRSILDGLDWFQKRIRAVRDGLRSRPAAFSLIVIVAQILIVAIAALWLQVLWGYLLTPQVSQRSPRSNPLLYAGLTMVLISLGAELVARRFRFRPGLVTAGAVMILIVVSNQFLVVYKLGDGQNDKEFLMLADWYVQNARGEKLVTTLPQIVSLNDQSIEPHLIRTSSIPGETLDDLVRECYKQKIAYLAWDSRIGLFKRDAYYKKWRMDRVAELQYPRDYGRLEFVAQFKHNDRRYINLYRLRPEAAPRLRETQQLLLPGRLLR